jgi:CDP-diacylglycerol--glycerol-3-phosphate 3-phosphatidyltransferase
MNYSLPNILSLFRIAVSPVFFYLITSSDPEFVQIGCYLFIAGALSDYADGWIARKYSSVTASGKFIDPLADKVLTIAAFIAFVYLDIIPFWMVAIVILRDIMTTGLRVYADYRNQALETSYLAKVKTFVQMVFIAIVLLLIFLKSFAITGIEPDTINKLLYSPVIDILMLVLNIITVWSAGEYLIQNWELISGISVRKRDEVL